MSEQAERGPESEPLYRTVVAGEGAGERGEDAVALAELLAATAGGELERVHIEKRSPAKRLFALAEEGRADLIVLGSTHRAAVGRVTPGSIAEHLLSGARCRLAIAPKGYARARAVGEAREELRVIAVGFDGTLESRTALGEAAELGRRAGAALRIVAVDSPLASEVGPAATMAAAEGARLQERLHEACGELSSELRAQPVYERGEPVETLLAQAERGVDLLVLGSHGFGPVLRLLLGSVAGKVIRAAPCPVLVMPRISEEP